LKWTLLQSELLSMLSDLLIHIGHFVLIPGTAWLRRSQAIHPTGF
jgi:hypothetical protein